VNASISIRDYLGPDSIATEESDLRWEKHIEPRTSTDPGRMISTKPVPMNAHFSIRDSLDPIQM
jgi:hypothetical protein